MKFMRFFNQVKMTKWAYKKVKFNLILPTKPKEKYITILLSSVDIELNISFKMLHHVDVSFVDSFDIEGVIWRRRRITTLLMKILKFANWNDDTGTHQSSNIAPHTQRIKRHPTRTKFWKENRVHLVRVKMRTIKRFAQWSPCAWTVSGQIVASDEIDENVEMFDISSMRDSYTLALALSLSLSLAIWLASVRLDGVLDLHKLHLIAGTGVWISFWTWWPYRTVSLDIDFKQYSIEVGVRANRYVGSSVIGSGDGSGKWNCFGIHIRRGMRYPKWEFVR